MKTHILCPITFFPLEKCVVYDNVGGKKIGTAGEARDDNMAHAHCLIDN